MGTVVGGVYTAVRNVLSVEQNITGGGGFQQIDTAQQGTLTGTGGTDNRCHIALVHCEINVTQNNMRTKGLRQVLNLQNTFTHPISPSLTPDCAP